MPEKNQKALEFEMLRRTPEAAKLYERLNVPGLGPFDPNSNPALPPIEIAPGFRKETPLIGVGTKQARDLETLYKFAPQLRGRAPSITSGYGPMYLRDLLEQANDNPKHNPESVKAAKLILERPIPLNIQGQTSVGIAAPYGAVEIGPHSKEDSSWVGTAGHELQHVLGILAAGRMSKEGRNSNLQKVLDRGIDGVIREEDPYNTDKLIMSLFSRMRK